MNKSQIQLVQESFALVEPMATVATHLFYGRLFELDPALRPSFKAPFVRQINEQMVQLAFIVMNLDRPNRLIPCAQSLGRQYARAGLKAAQYETVGAALLWTLAYLHQERFTPEVAAAWTAAYAVVGKTMLKAAAVAHYRIILRGIRARFRHKQSYGTPTSVSPNKY